VTAAPLDGLHANGSLFAGTLQAGQFQIRTNLLSQIRYRLSASGATTIVRVATYGWLDRRGRG
jgi:hypothetical protein